MDKIILTFPRSGSHYLRELMSQKLGIETAKSHEVADSEDRYTISIVRNPSDTLKSIITLYNHHSKITGVENMVNAYCDFYKFIINDADLVIDYNDLVDRTDLVIQKLSSVFNAEISPSLYTNKLFDIPELQHLVSSKISEEYEKVDMSKVDLSRANDYYRLALTRCINL